jgi:hypothetical protein
MANALTTGLVAVLASGVGAGVVTFALNRWRAEKESRRTKLEALYLAIHKYVEMMNLINLQVRTGRWQPNDSDNEKVTEQVDMINLLIELYFRPLIPAFDNFKKKQQDFITTNRRFRTAGEGDIKKEFLSLVDEGKELKQRVLDLARQKRII